MEAAGVSAVRLDGKLEWRDKIIPSPRSTGFPAILGDHTQWRKLNRGYVGNQRSSSSKSEKNGVKKLIFFSAAFL